jgi:hypothetical protein
MTLGLTIKLNLLQVPLCIFFSIWGAESFAFWLSESDSVARIAGNMKQCLEIILCD